MATPNWSDLFPGAEVITDLEDAATVPSETEPCVIIPWATFANGRMNDPGKLDNPERFFAALALSMQNFYDSDSTEEPLIELDPVRFTVDNDRNGETKGAYPFGFTFYMPYEIPTLDPDLM